MIALRARAALTAVVVALGVSVGVAPAASAHPAGLGWRMVDTGTTEHFRGLAPVSRKVAWLGGYNGLVLRTTDGGHTWDDVSPAGAQTLQFRDVSAFDAKHAVAMAAGGGTDSRLYATTDGGETWTLAYENTDDQAFFDCMAFFDRRHGLVLSDPVDGRFRILSTRDGGQSWTVLPDAGMPAALAGEFAFAASGQCLTTSGKTAWFGAGGADAARVFGSTDGGLTWTVETTPLVSGPSAGVFGLAVRDRLRVAVGGDFAAPGAATDVAARSTRPGRWTSATDQPSGYRSGITFLPRGERDLVAVGLTGSDVSRDGGRTWTTFDTGQFDTVACAKDGACWASGDLGRVAVLTGR
jgi:photosystem II stability/assembly factor-like uncharacterized protein